MRLHLHSNKLACALVSGAREEPAKEGMTGEETRAEGLMRGMKWKWTIKALKRTVCHQRRLSRLGKEQEGDFADYFVDRLNKSIKAHWSTLIELHKWDWGGAHGKASTKQHRGWAECGFGHFLKLIIHAGPSVLFFYPLICPSVCQSWSVYSSPPRWPLLTVSVSWTLHLS